MTMHLTPAGNQTIVTLRNERPGISVISTWMQRRGEGRMLFWDMKVNGRWVDWHRSDDPIYLERGTADLLTRKSSIDAS